MAWMAKHLFVRCDDIARVESALTELLRGAEHLASLEDFDDPPAPVVVCPPHEGWVAVTGAGAWLDDLPWAAERLSAACAAVAASCEVFGNCYRMQLAVFDAGKEQRRRRSPEKEGDDHGPMPIYEDVEQLAWSALRELGIPAALIAVGTHPHGCRDHDTGAGAGVTLRRRDEEIERGELPVTLPHGADSPPVLPTRTSQDFGLMIFEDRYLEGLPGEAALARLLELEQRFTERARAAHDASRGQISTTFTYYAGPHQERLDGMLRAHDHHTLPVEQRVRPPWWAFWRYFGKLR